jgi:uncharacterized membrane protein
MFIFISNAGEELIGARAYRVIFALTSLPLAVAAVVYFLNHRYDGVALWNIRWVCFLGFLHTNACKQFCLSYACI